ELGHSVGAARIERGGFALRNFLNQTIEFGGRRLIKAGLLLEPQNTDGFQNTKRAQSIRVGGIFRLFKTDRDMGLGGEIVDLVRLYQLDDADQAGAIGQIAVVEHEARVLFVRILIEMIDAIRIEQGGAALDAVNLVTLVEQEL